ncbi:MAG: glycosyltransferase family 2 protein [Bacteroidota bacterium]|nr:glycosyltransferase family 2 protein [Bacteroidota bacterium]
MNLTIVVPLLNEEESITELSSWIKTVCNNNNLLYELLFIDDGSSDSSWRVIEKLIKEDSSVKALKFRRNYGKSAALHEGFAVANGDVVITMDADLQDSPEEIPALYKMIVEEGNDIVSGWKKKRHDPINKRLPSKLFNRFTRWMSGIKLHDFNCGLKAYKNEVVKNIEVYGEMHRYIPVIAKWEGFDKIVEKEVIHHARKYGKTKFGMERYLKGFLDIISIMFVSKFGKRPMHFFGAIGTLLFIAGFSIAFYLAYAKVFMAEYNMTDRPLFFLGLLSMILGTQLFMTGFLADLVSRNGVNKNKYSIDKIIGFDKKL